MVKMKNPKAMKSRGILISNEMWAALDAARKEHGSIDKALRVALKPVQRRNAKDWPLCATCKTGVTSADAEAKCCTNCGSELKVIR